MKSFLKVFTLFVFFLTANSTLSAQPWGDCDCDHDFEPVCVADSLGNAFALPNACYAECFGFTTDDFVECDSTLLDGWGNHGGGHNGHGGNHGGNGGHGGNNGGHGGNHGGGHGGNHGDHGGHGGGHDNPCDCDHDWAPVCVADTLGNMVAYPNECYALCFGYVIEDFVECDSTVFEGHGHHGGGHGGHGGQHGDDDEFLCSLMDCDCSWDIDPVCVLDTLGNQIVLPNACFTECLGYVIADIVECDSASLADTHWLDDEPVCVEDTLGNILTFPNHHLAKCAGYNHHDKVDCPEEDGYMVIDNGIENGLGSEMTGNIAQTNASTNAANIDNNVATNFSKISVAPNPVIDNLQVNFKLEAEGQVIIQITSFQGMVVNRMAVQAVAGTNNLEIPATNLIPGVYLLTIQNGDKIEVVKFVK